MKHEEMCKLQYVYDYLIINNNERSHYMIAFKEILSNALQEHLKEIENAKIQTTEEHDLEKALHIVLPLATKCGVSEEDTRTVLTYIEDMSKRGVDGNEAALALRVVLARKDAEKKNKYIASDEISKAVTRIQIEKYGRSSVSGTFLEVLSQSIAEVVNTRLGINND